MYNNSRTFLDNFLFKELITHMIKITMFPLLIAYRVPYCNFKLDFVNKSLFLSYYA